MGLSRNLPSDFLTEVSRCLIGDLGHYVIELDAYDNSSMGDLAGYSGHPA